MARAPRTSSGASRTAYEWRTPHAFNALKDLLGEELYEEAKQRSGARGWHRWIQDMWAIVDERGWTTEAMAAVTAANEAAGFWDGRQHATLVVKRRQEDDG